MTVDERRQRRHETLQNVADIWRNVADGPSPGPP